jgi:hypothetical protein
MPISFFNAIPLPVPLKRNKAMEEEYNNPPRNDYCGLIKREVFKKLHFIDERSHQRFPVKSLNASWYFGFRRKLTLVAHHSRFSEMPDLRLGCPKQLLQHPCFLGAIAQTEICLDPADEIDTILSARVMCKF